MIARGRRCSLNTLSRKSCTIVLVVKGWDKEMKCAYLVSLSTTTRIVSCPSDFGKISMKSIVICYQAISGMSKGYKRPGYGVFLDLFF
jgi:hypothetical protein